MPSIVVTDYSDYSGYPPPDPYTLLSPQVPEKAEEKTLTEKLKENLESIGKQRHSYKVPEVRVPVPVPVSAPVKASRPTPASSKKAQTKKKKEKSAASDARPRPDEMRSPSGGISQSHCQGSSGQSRSESGRVKARKHDSQKSREKAITKRAQSQTHTEAAIPEAMKRVIGTSVVRAVRQP